MEGDVTASGAYQRAPGASAVPPGAVSGGSSAAPGAAPAPTAAAPTPAPAPGKVNRVCGLVRGAIAAVAPDRLLLAALTTHVRQRPPDLSGALHAVLDRARAAGVSVAALAPGAFAAAAAAGGGAEGEGEGEGEVDGDDEGGPPAVIASAASGGGGPSWEAALRHVIVLSDVATLYRTALGACVRRAFACVRVCIYLCLCVCVVRRASGCLDRRGAGRVCRYDVDTAALVAAQAQMDPRECAVAAHVAFNCPRARC